MSILNNPGLWWVPFTIFGIVLLIGLLIGFWNGWKTALYFSIWPFVGLLIGTFTTKYLFSFLQGYTISGIGDLSEFLLKNERWTTPLFLIIYLLFFYFAAFNFYWIARKALKRYIKVSQKEGYSTIWYRISGAGIGVITALPMAVMLTNASAFVTTTQKDDKFTFATFNDYLVKGLTFGQKEGGSQVFPGLSAALVHLGSDEKQKALIEDFKGIFDGTKTISEANIDTIKEILKSPITLGAVLDIVSKDETHKSEITDALNDPNILKNIGDTVTTTFGGKLSAPAAVKDRLAEILDGFVTDKSRIPNIVSAIFK